MADNVKNIDPLVDDNDREASRRFVIQLPGCFMLPDTGEAVFCQIVNISNTGIGVITREPLEDKTKITWVTLEQLISFEVVWCLKNITDSDDGFRYQCGLLSLDSETYLEKLFGQIQQYPEAK